MASIVFDTETSGLSPGRACRVVEIGAVRIGGAESVDEFHALIDVDVPTHGRRPYTVSAGRCCAAPPPDQVFAEFRYFIGRSKLVAHNAPFDIRFLRAEFAHLGFGLPNHVACTLKLSRRK